MAASTTTDAGAAPMRQSATASKSCSCRIFGDAVRHGAIMPRPAGGPSTLANRPQRPPIGRIASLDAMHRRRQKRMARPATAYGLTWLAAVRLIVPMSPKLNGYGLATT